MGFLSQGKPLQTEHLFFAHIEDKNETQGRDEAVFAPVTHGNSDDGANYDDEYHGVDDMGANEEADSDAGDDHIVYDESEYAGSGKNSSSGSSSERG
jgi:hypothetical protein